MKLKNIALSLIGALGSITYAQSNINADLSIGIGSKAQTVALGLNRLHGIGKSKKLSLGYGIRYTGYMGKDNEFVTAPANVSEGNLFTPQNEVKLDTLTMDGNVGSINAAIYIDYRLNEKWRLQFNIDAIGFSFGGEKTGTFMAASQNASQNNVKAKPTGTNLLLTGDYDIGSLNSELTALYNFKGKHSVKFGFMSAIKEPSRFFRSYLFFGALHRIIAQDLKAHWTVFEGTCRRI